MISDSNSFIYVGADSSSDICANSSFIDLGASTHFNFTSNSNLSSEFNNIDSLERGESKDTVEEKYTSKLNIAQIIIQNLPGKDPSPITVERVQIFVPDFNMMQKDEKLTGIKQRKSDNHKKLYTYDMLEGGVSLHTGHLLGNGASKTAKILAKIECDHPTLFARVTAPTTGFEVTPVGHQMQIYSQVYLQLEKEIEVTNLFKGQKEIAQILYHYAYLSQHVGRIGMKKISMTMPYYNGGDLKNYFLKLNNIKDASEREKLIKELVYIFGDILKGLKIMQKKGVVHRDLKPANIFLHRDSFKEPLQGIIGDLGFAEHTNLNMKAPLRATPLYLAPESFLLELNKEDKLLNLCNKIMASKDKNPILYSRKDEIENLIQNYPEKNKLTLNPKIDIWSFGVTIYEALYGEYFYTDLNIASNSSLSLNSPERLNNLIKRSSQYSVKELLEIKENSHPTKDSNEIKLRSFLKEILILDQQKRPDARDALKLFNREFLQID